MLRAAYWLSAVLYLPFGVLLYFFPSSLSQLLSINPLWLARLCGALITAWGGLMVAAPFYPDSLTRYGLAAANLLALATLLPAALRGSLGGNLDAVSALLMVAAALLGLSGVLALLGGKRRA